MTMLAAAGIYLILDVNSPRIGESLNRYEPWTSYTPEYLEHIFKVVHQFSGYNNTLGFFAGNEVINDDRSATNSPNYMKAVIRDIKTYIHYNSPRTIPVGYSAADDLRYRISLSKYLECGDDFSTVDFYGVNSYQWCGKQTFTSSGYDTLVNDYVDYSLPLIFSEYGCNAMSPRPFQEIEAVYSSEMTNVFSGGLIYEFSQEPNYFGLVEMDPNGNVYLLEDFNILRTQYKQYPHNISELAEPKKATRPRQCLGTYENLNTRDPLPETFATSLISKGINTHRGRYVNVTTKSTSHKIYDVDEVEITVKELNSTEFDMANIPKPGQVPQLPQYDQLRLNDRDESNKHSKNSSHTHRQTEQKRNQSSSISTSSVFWSGIAAIFAGFIIFENGW